jgi:transposase
MPKATKRTPLILSEEDHKLLESISKSMTKPKREVDRAKVLLLFAAKTQIKDIVTKTGLSEPAIYKAIDKALAMGAMSGLKDLPHRPKAPTITLEAKAWVTSIACTKPKDLGFAAEVWSRQSLANYIREHAISAGHECLKLAVKATVQRILEENKLSPEKVKYYLEKKDPQFNEKMQEILLVYQEVKLSNQSPSNSHEEQGIVTVCVDEKPGVQAIANITPDLAPVAGKHKTITRDPEYKRLGTASILAGIDLHNGHVFAQVHARHRSIEFISLLKEIDARYDKTVIIRLILDNHSAHTSKETRAFLATKPGRFIYVHTPVHGSWLNLAETLFSKMARTFLKHIRVSSWDELKERILKGVEEINKNPVVHQWNKFDALGLI